MNPFKFCKTALLLLTLSACAMGPDYKRPALDMPEHFREGWAQAAVQPATGAW